MHLGDCQEKKVAMEGVVGLVGGVVYVAEKEEKEAEREVAVRKEVGMKGTVDMAGVELPCMPEMNCTVRRPQVHHTLCRHY
jgi:hypothetical protein